MMLGLEQSEFFWIDFERQVDWYRDNAGVEVAEDFIVAVESTLDALRNQPTFGRPRFRNHPLLTGIRSFRVQPPFHRILIFYRFDSVTIFAERMIHGARDLPRRVLENPAAE